ncbi:MULTISPECIES: YaaC family protein [unclassified Sphingobacterium]|uniref:YaaC family protein n=1 Tax=unclassified Sphingobacterium TaxID=2609468 RepID=UPI0020C24BA4|nr:MULTISPECIES: YaaC family protein [unclassified Sphingobacterium]
MKLEEIGEMALRDYRPVKYFPFNNEAGSAFILTSEPFNYLEAFLSSELSSVKRDAKKRKENLRKSIYFTKLSQDFYNSSLTAAMPSKGTLLYYSFINLVKVYLIQNGYDLEKKVEHHGLSLPPNSKETLKLASLNGSGISIFHEFAKTLDWEISNKDGVDITFSDLLRDLPEIHEISYALGLFPGTKRKFLPVDIQIRTDRTRKKIYLTLSYEKKFDKLMNTTKLYKGKFNDLFEKLDIIDDNRCHHFKSKLVLKYTYNSSRSWKICYPKLLKNIKELGIFPMITRSGYRFYLDLENSRLHRLNSILGFAFYLGTVARYRPTLNEEILKGEYQAAINEAIVSCPNQFFYILVSYITKQVCAIPMAKIN